jgi:4-hydroxy-tetrahydrodipicolinate synthase
MTDLLQASGVYALAATPFEADGRLDARSTDSLVDFYLQCGVQGLTVLGILGEAPKLDADEALAFVRQVVHRSGTKPVIVGVSSPGFAAMRVLARSAMDLGAAGVLIGPPNTLRTDDQIVGYFHQAAQAIGPDVPFVLQDHPLMLQVVMSPNVIRRIVQEVPSCCMLKHEDWPGLEKLSLLRGFEAEGSMRRIPILCANGGLFLDMEYQRGADGSMTGYAFADMLVELFNLCRDGARDAAQDLFDAHLPLIRYEQQTGVGLAVRKYILMRRGAIASDAQRRPASPMSSGARAEVDYLLARLAKRCPRYAV